MMFHDAITIVDAVDTVVYAYIPAYVGSAASAEAGRPEAPTADLVTLRALIPPAYAGLIVDDAHRVVWRGHTYTIPSPPLPRMKRGQVHHVTVPMSRT